jgi:hypothetical protein
MTTQLEPKNIIDIPKIENYELFNANQDRAFSKNIENCPCCGKGLINPKYFINSIYGGQAYPSSDTNTYSDAWVMAVGSECKKRFPEGYVYQAN